MGDIENSLAGAALVRALELLQAGEHMPERTGLGASGAIEHIIELVQSAWDTLHASGLNVNGTSRPSGEDINARPAYWLLQTLTWLAFLSRGPLFFWSLFYGTSYVGGVLNWRLHIDMDEFAPVNVPDNAEGVEFEICTRAPASNHSHGTNQRFYATFTGGPVSGQNTLAVNALYYVSYRARFVDANYNPVSLWAYSNEETPDDLCIPPGIPSDLPVVP